MPEAKKKKKPAAAARRPARKAAATKKSARPAAGRRGAARPRVAPSVPAPQDRAAATSVSERTVSTTTARREERQARVLTGPTITIVQTGSGIGCPVRQKRVLEALGLRHPRHRVVRPDNPAVRGMVAAVPHLARIVEEQRGA